MYVSLSRIWPTICSQNRAPATSNKAAAKIKTATETINQSPPRQRASKTSAVPPLKPKKLTCVARAVGYFCVLTHLYAQAFSGKTQGYFSLDRPLKAASQEAGSGRIFVVRPRLITHFRNMRKTSHLGV